MATTVYKPVHETTETANYQKVTAAIRFSYHMHADLGSDPSRALTRARLGIATAIPSYSE